MSQAQLIQITDLLQNGASSDFLAQFQPRPLTVQIVAGGVLGAMSWMWQQQGDTAFSAVIQSESMGGSPWSYTPPDPAYGVLTFAPGTYVANDVYTVGSTGIVTGGSFAGLSATRYDLRQVACLEATSIGVTLMQPRVVPPVLSVGPQIVGWLCDIANYRLRSRQGLTPADAGAGDDNVRARAEAAEKNLQRIGISEDRPPDLVDSSEGDTGLGFNAYPTGDSLRGW